MLPAVLLTTALLAGTAAAQQAAPRAAAGSCPESLAALYDQVSPAVVSILAVTVNPYDSEHRIERVGGSGVIIDSSGLILSNSHVVFGRQAVTVTLDDGTAVPAKLVGADPTFDVALLRIPSPTSGTLPAVKFGSSSQLRVGDDVFAIGNPLGLEQTLTRGIVSAINRLLPGGGWSLTEPLIQTDAAINPGNSGGPLVDTCGALVGITTAILPEARSIGFAVPIDVVRVVLPQLLEKGRVIRPWLGVQGQFVPAELKELLRLPLSDGFMVEAVEPGSPADQKGVQGGMFELTLDGQPLLLGGDIVTQVNGTKIDGPEKLMTLLAGFDVGKTVKLTLERAGKTQTVELALTERPMQPWDLPSWRSSAPQGNPSDPTSARRVRATRHTIVF